MVDWNIICLVLRVGEVLPMIGTVPSFLFHLIRSFLWGWVVLRSPQNLAMRKRWKVWSWGARTPWWQSHRRQSQMHSLILWFLMIKLLIKCVLKKTRRKTNIKNNLMVNQDLPKEVGHKENNSVITTAFRKDLSLANSFDFFIFQE